MARNNHLEPSLAGGDDAFPARRPAEGFRLFPVVQFDEIQDRLLELLDGVVDAAPEPPSSRQFSSTDISITQSQFGSKEPATDSDSMRTSFPNTSVRTPPSCRRRQKNEGGQIRRPEPTAEPAVRQNTEN